jgi:hypothetical protein
MKQYRSGTCTQSQRDSDLAEVKARLHELFSNGFWYCASHDGTCERVESDQGQPAMCDRCGSIHIEWNPPIWAATKLEGKV